MSGRSSFVGNLSYILSWALGFPAFIAVAVFVSFEFAVLFGIAMILLRQHFTI